LITQKNQTQPEIHQKISLNPSQLEIFHDTHRFQIADCGRRFGKTNLAWIKCLLFMLDNDGCLLWWVAPYYKELAPATQTVKALTPTGLIAKKYEQGRKIRSLILINGSEITFHSADREDSLRGMKLHGMVIDEAAALKEDRWSGELEPSLIDLNGWCLFIGTPKGKNWFHNLYQKGTDPQNRLYKSWHFSSYANSKENGGFIPKANIDAIANDMPELMRRQEIEAIFLEGEGVVFRNIVRQIREASQIKPYYSGEFVSVGSDLGKNVDFTVNVAMRLNGEIVGFERFKSLDWPFQRRRTIEFAKRFGNASLLLDSSGLGDPIFDEVNREYGNVAGYKLTNATKKALIENLSIMLDNGEVWFPGNPRAKEFDSVLDPEFPVLKSELESFAYELTSSGLVKYNAPEGLHDDTVIALALAAWQIKRNVRPPKAIHG
jgi:hypothetical protein